MELAKIHTSFSIQKVAHPSGLNLQLAAETCEFLQVPSLSMVSLLLNGNVVLTGFLVVEDK